MGIQTENSTVLHLLPPETMARVFALATLLSVLPGRNGPEYHSLLVSGSQEPLEGFPMIREWLETALQKSFSRSQILRAAGQPDRWKLGGFWAARFSSPQDLAEHGQGLGCPRILFGRGHFPQEAFHVAFFNSRKPRSLSPQAPWLQGMRAFMEKTMEASWSLASSLGTLTHDLVTHAGNTRSIPMTLVVHDSFHRFAAVHERYGFSSMLKARTVVTCQAPGMLCSKEKLMVCRDRILAHLAQAHLVLELRAGGNLFRILRDLHARSPRHLFWFAASGKEERYTSIREKTARSINAKARPFFLEAGKKNVQAPPGIEDGIRPRQCKTREHKPARHSPPEDWGRYLYHYTRSCWGPWPGQTYEDYLDALYKGREDAGHTVLDTLACILREGRIRAGSKIIRGSLPVVSWTRLAPGKIHEMRRWNRALVRWTIEPYGIGVLGERLKKLGAKPTVYGPASIFQRMKESERYRFQRHEPPNVCWRHEREYRLSGDLHLTELNAKDYFVFVPRSCDAEHLRRLIPHVGAIVIVPMKNLNL